MNAPRKSGNTSPPASHTVKSPTAPGSTPQPERGAAPPLPHERDEAAGHQSTGSMGEGAAGVEQRRVMDQARRDLAEGKVDTDLRSTPGLDAERREQLVKRPR